MLVFAKQKLVLMAMPKTGTSALETALSPYADVVLRNPPILKHTPAYRFAHKLVPYLASSGLTDLETLCCVRHPVSWLGSWYRYRSRPYLNGHPNSTRDVSFEDFVNEYTKGKPQEFAKVGSPSRFVRDRNGAFFVDHMFQYEQFDKLIAFLEDRLGYDILLDRENVSPQGDLTLSDKTKAKLERKRPEMFDDWHAARR